MSAVENSIAQRLMPDAEQRAELWQRIIGSVESYIGGVDGHRIMPELSPDKIRSLINSLDLTKQMEPLEAIDFVVNGSWLYQTHTAHRRYFGLFDPAPN